MTPPIPFRVEQILAGTRSIQDLSRAEQRLSLELGAARHSNPDYSTEAIYAALHSTKGARSHCRKAEPSELRQWKADGETGDAELARIASAQSG